MGLLRKINNGADSCPSHAIYESEIKPVIEDIFKSGQQNIEELSACVLNLVSELLESNDNKNELISLNKQLETQHKMKTKLLKFNAEGNMSDSEFFRMTKECDEEISKLQAQNDTIKDSEKTEQEMKKELSNIKAILKAAEKHIDGEEIDKAFIDRYIKEIIVYPEKDITRLEIRLNAGTSVSKILENTASRTGQISNVATTQQQFFL